MKALLDLGVGDVHIDGAVRAPKGKKTMGEITTKGRKALPGSAFALPGKRKLPIHDESHAKNARARLEQIKGALSPSEYASAKRKIEAAERRFGVKAAVKRVMPKGRGLRMRIHPDGGIDVRHMTYTDGGLAVLPPVDLTLFEA